MWEMELIFRTCGFAIRLDQIDPKRVIRPEAVRQKHIWTFDKSIVFILKFWLKWGIACEKWN